MVIQLLTTEEQRIVRQMSETIFAQDLETARAILAEHVGIFRKSRIDVVTNSSLDIFLASAASTGNVKMVRLFLDHGADIDAPIWKDPEETAISSIYRDGDKCLDVLRFLLERKAKYIFEYKGKLTCPALLSAALNGALECVKLLIAHGAPVNSLSPRGQTPLDLATMYGKKDVMDYLMSIDAKAGYEVGGWVPEGMRPPAGSLAEHLERYLGPVKPLAVLPIVPTVLPIRMWRIDRDDEQFLVTDGLASFAMPPFKELEESPFHPSPYAELLLRLPSDWPVTNEALADASVRWPLEWLFKIANWPAEQNAHFGNSTIFSNGEPPESLASNTNLSCWMVTRTWFDFASWQRPDGTIVNIYLMVPIYTEEREFEKMHGHRALLNALMDANVPICVAPARQNVGVP